MDWVETMRSFFFSFTFGLGTLLIIKALLGIRKGKYKSRRDREKTEQHLTDFRNTFPSRQRRRVQRRRRK